ncbi:MAG TPA: glycosyltransferase, partial [Thermomicrobiales bacterium]
MRTHTKRALVCAPRVPEYDREGGARRIYHFIEFLRDAGWSVSFIAHDASGGEQYARTLRQMGVATYAGEASNKTGDEYLLDPAPLIAHGRFDLAILIFWNIAERYLPVLRALSPETCVIVDSVDLHFLRNARGVFNRATPDGPTTLDGNYAQEMMRELNVYAQADVVMAVSEKEAGLINDFLADPCRASTVPLMEDDLPAGPPFAERSGILFLGNFRHPPNAEALAYLCERVLPLLSPALREEHPLSVVGNGLDAKTINLARHLDHIRMVGWVPSLVPYVQRARISVVPVLHGAGTKTKLIQALTAGTPSVSTSIGIEGLDLHDGEQVLVADDPATFARAMTRLLEDATLWQRLAMQGYTHIAATHGRAAVRERFWSVIAEACERAPHDRPEGATRSRARRTAAAARPPRRAAIVGTRDGATAHRDTAAPPLAPRAQARGAESSGS